MKKEIIGIIGGIGPYAGIDLVQKIFDNTVATLDVDHLPVILYSIPQIIPDRTNYILDKSNVNPANGIIKALSQMLRNNASHLAIACNAAHSPMIFNPVKTWLNQKHPKTKLYNIVDETIQYIKHLPNINTVGVLAVQGTYKAKVYQHALSENGINVVQLPDKLQNKVHNSIWNPNYGIKAFSNPVQRKAKSQLLEIIQFQKKQGAKAIILGCTEIPLAIQEQIIDDVFILDASTILARTIVKNVASEQLSDDSLLATISST
jgi:aspartate racemase